MKHILFVCLFPFVIGASCKKTITPPPPPPVTEGLPPATQEGKNTCGFLVNGKVWLPKGRRGDGSPNLKCWYDPAYRNGTFNINGFRYDDKEGTMFTGFSIGVSNVSRIGIYRLNYNDTAKALFSDYNRNCVYYTEDTIPAHNSFLNITKFDLQNGIIAGMFQFTLAKVGCDTISITEGRFDIKL
ncbi:MAG: hypothetical protein ACR2KX_20040 [Chitinophagaceae bacterium]